MLINVKKKVTIPSTKTKGDPPSKYSSCFFKLTETLLLTDFRHVSNHPGTVTFHGFSTHILDVPIDTHFADPAPGALAHHACKVMELGVKEELLEDISWADCWWRIDTKRMGVNY